MHSFIESSMEQLFYHLMCINSVLCFLMETFLVYVRIISGNSNNSDPESNLHFSIVTKHHISAPQKNENHLILQFWVTFGKLVSTDQENNDQLEVNSIHMLLVKEEHRIISHTFRSLVSILQQYQFPCLSITVGFVKLLDLTYKGIFKVTFILFRI